LVYRVNLVCLKGHVWDYLNGAITGVPAASGMDIAIIENEQIKSLHLFLDTPQG
jgi:hypothetical protein